MIRDLNTRYGVMFVPDTDRGQFWWLSNTGASPEDGFIEMICELLDERPKGVAVDVGANFGCWTLPLSKHAHRVIAIEPQSGCRKLLTQSIATNKFKNITTVAAAAGEQPGTSLIPILNLESETNFGGVSLAIPHEEQPNAGMDTVTVVRLDDLLQGEQVSFIKIDVEGFEQKVLNGLQETLARCKPILFVEMDHKLTDREALKLWLEGAGYFVEQQGGNYLGVPT